MAKNSKLAAAQRSLKGAAKTGADELKNVATEALGAAAAAAAGVVMDRVAGALGAGEQRADAGAAQAAKQISAQPFMAKGSKAPAKKAAKKAAKKVARKVAKKAPKKTPKKSVTKKRPAKRK